MSLIFLSGAGEEDAECVAFHRLTRPLREGEGELVCRPFFRAQIGVKSGAAAAELLFEPRLPLSLSLSRSRNLERHKEKLISLIFGLRVDDAINNLLQGMRVHVYVPL